MLDRDSDDALANLYTSEYANDVPLKRSKYFPRTMFIVMRYDCPYNCDHCFFFSNPNSKDILSDDTLDKALDFAARMRIGAIMLTGGEPMLDPDRVFRTVDRINKLGINPSLQSSYLGNNEVEIEENAERFSRVGLVQFITTISQYHERAKPASIEMDYLDYVVAMIDAMSKRGIHIGIKNPWDVEHGDSSEEHTLEFLKKMMAKGAVVLKDFINPRGWGIQSMNSGFVDFMDPSIVSVGNARSHDLVSQKPVEYEAKKYFCPIFHTDLYSNLITVYPDGNVARCCVAEKRADFGFGNAQTDSFRDILLNIAGSDFVQPAMDVALKEGHAMLIEEFPQLLPKGGVHLACEICSPIVSHPAAKLRLAERLGVPDLFVPFTQKQID